MLMLINELISVIEVISIGIHLTSYVMNSLELSVFSYLAQYTCTKKGNVEYNIDRHLPYDKGQRQKFNVT